MTALADAPTETDAVTTPRRRLWPALVTVALILIFLGQMAFTMVTAARQQSATADEPVYIGAAVSYVKDHRIRYNVEHPPLAKEFMALGMAAGHIKKSAKVDGSQWQVGRAVLYSQGNDVQRTLLYARVPMIILTLLFGLVVFFFARDLVGTIGGVMALAVYSFLPDVIAHGSLATLDMPTAGFLLTSFWLLWRGRTRPWLYLPLAGVAVGLALATKMNALIAVPLVAVIGAWAYLARDRKRWPKALLVVAVIAGAAIATVWATYLAVDPMLRSVSAQHIPPFHGIKALFFQLLPFPGQFRDGMRYQIGLEGAGNYGGFLLGERYTGSKWYYLPVALLIKEPIGAIVLFLGGAAAMLTIKRLRPAALYVLVPSVLLLAFAMTGSRDWGVRYAIFIPVFGAVMAAAVLAFKPLWTKALAAALVLYVGISSALTFPYYLPYSNEAFGGTADTYQNLHDSNVDWGQDMARTAGWLKQRYPGEKIWLLYHGGGDPKAYGLDASDPGKVPVSQVHGLLVVSDFNLMSPSGPTRRLLESTQKLGEVGHTTTILWRP